MGNGKHPVAGAANVQASTGRQSLHGRRGPSWGSHQCHALVLSALRMEGLDGRRVDRMSDAIQNSPGHSLAGKPPSRCHESSKIVPVGRRGEPKASAPWLDIYSSLP